MDTKKVKIRIGGAEKLESGCDYCSGRIAGCIGKEIGVTETEYASEEGGKVATLELSVRINSVKKKLCVDPHLYVKDMINVTSGTDMDIKFCPMCGRKL